MVELLSITASKAVPIQAVSLACMLILSSSVLAQLHSIFFQVHDLLFLRIYTNRDLGHDGL
jgi:hypothetical protein